MNTKLRVKIATIEVNTLVGEITVSWFITVSHSDREIVIGQGSARFAQDTEFARSVIPVYEELALHNIAEQLMQYGVEIENCGQEPLCRLIAREQLARTPLAC